MEERAMRQLRRAGERGHADHGWLDTWHTFSFADYYDPKHQGFRLLRVINEDVVQPGQGFGMHPHRDMEIVTYVLEGQLQHRDSMGNGSVLHAGELQRITAGRGVLHSEFNPSEREHVHLYQIWLLPRARGLAPGYEEKQFNSEEKRNRLRLVASPDGADGSLTIQQDARISIAVLDPGKQVTHPLSPGRHAWLQVIRGQLEVDGTMLTASDGLAITDEAELSVQAASEAEVMLFDLP